MMHFGWQRRGRFGALWEPASTTAALATYGAAIGGPSAVVGTSAALTLPSLGTLATVASLVGTGLSVVGSISQGAAANRAARTQADIFRQQAERERQEAAMKETDYRRLASRQLATRRALLGGSGVEPGEGSPLLTTADMAGEAEYQALRIRSGGETAATRLDQQAALTRTAGLNARRAGLYRGGASLLRGGASLLRGAGEVVVRYG